MECIRGALVSIPRVPLHNSQTASTQPMQRKIAGIHIYDFNLCPLRGRLLPVSWEFWETYLSVRKLIELESVSLERLCQKTAIVWSLICCWTTADSLFFCIGVDILLSVHWNSFSSDLRLSFRACSFACIARFARQKRKKERLLTVQVRLKFIFR